jgi:Aspartyl/Asparaginyl beta-hydroxylase
MKNFMSLGNAHTLPLMIEIQRQPDLWKADTYLRDYPQGPFGDTETIFLRFPPASVTELERGQKDQHESVWMDGAIHLPYARRLIFDLMNLTQGERLGRVMINKLRPGGRIYPHADTPAHAQYWERYHLVLQSGPGCVFRCGDEKLELPTGQVWWFDHRLEHEVVNNSKEDRIHMIVDIRCSKFDFKGITPTSVKPAGSEGQAKITPVPPRKEVPPTVHPPKTGKPEVYKP